MYEIIKKNINFKFGLYIFIFAGLFLFISLSQKKTRSKDISPYVVSVQRGFLSENISSSGEIQAKNKTNISPRKAGFIKSITSEEGDLVKKGQILAYLDDSDFIYKLEELKFISEKQKSDYLRRKFLYDEGAISRETLEEFKNKFNTSNAKLKDAIQEKEFYLIKAPFEGVITAKYAEIGSYVAPSSNLTNNGNSKSSIFELSNGKEIIAKVPESDIGRIKIGQEALVRVEAYPSKKFVAKIIKISPRAIKDNNVTSFEVTLDFLELTENIKIGMTVDLEFKVDDKKEKILVPTVSIVTENGSKGILTLDKNNSPKFKRVELGISSGNKTSVIKGLKEGEKVFIDIPPWSKKKR